MNKNTLKHLCKQALLLRNELHRITERVEPFLARVSVYEDDVPHILGIAKERLGYPGINEFLDNITELSAIPPEFEWDGRDGHKVTSYIHRDDWFMLEGLNHIDLFTEEEISK